MQTTKETNDKIVAWITNKVKTEYAVDVSLVLIYGSYVNGTAHSKSDVDCYYIPKTERGYYMATDFIIDGVGYDIFPMSWDRVQRIADLKENLQPLVGDAQIIYYGSSDDLERFHALQERLKNNLFDSEYVRTVAKSRCEDANKMCTKMNRSDKASEIRKLAGSIIMTLADAVAVYNHDYYHFGLKRQFKDLQNNFVDVPQSIVQAYKGVVEAGDVEDVKKYAMQMLQNVSTYLGIEYTSQDLPETTTPASNKIDVVLLAELYEEISSTFNKIYVCCEKDDHILAFLSAVCLQRDLDEAREAGCPEYDLLGGFHCKQLCQFVILVQKAEDDLVQFIERNGGRIKKYDSFEQFEMADCMEKEIRRD